MHRGQRAAHGAGTVISRGTKTLVGSMLVGRPEGRNKGKITVGKLLWAKGRSTFASNEAEEEVVTEVLGEVESEGDKSLLSICSPERPLQLSSFTVLSAHIGLPPRQQRGSGAPDSPLRSLLNQGQHFGLLLP